jgi:hypothetical protein
MKKLTHSRWTGALAALLVANLVANVSAQNSLTLALKWQLKNTDRAYLNVDAAQPRGIMINRTTGHVLIPLKDTPAVYILNGADGSDLGTLNMTGVSGGTYTVILGGVADDGAIYVCNLVTGGSSFTIYRWASESAVPTIAYGPAAAGPTATRIGDSFSVRGSGANTQLIASGTGSQYVTVFTTTDGVTFTAAQQFDLTTVGLSSGDARRGLAFDGTSAAFYCMNTFSNAVHHLSFDLTGGALGNLGDVTVSPSVSMISLGQIGGYTVMPAIDDNGFSSSIHTLEVFDMSNPSSPVVTNAVAFPTQGGTDGNITGATDIGANMIVALNTTAGVLALQAVTNPPVIVQAPADVTNYVGLTAQFSVAVSGSPPFSYQWEENGTNLPGETATNLVLSPLALASAGTYSVVVTNVVGTNTATAQLTVLPVPTAIDLSSNLVLHLKFNGDFKDYSGRGNNGAGVNSMTFVSDGVLGQAAHFETDLSAGITNYVELGLLPDLEFGSNCDFSLACWVRLPEGEQPGDVPFIGNAVGAGDSPGYFFGPTWGTGGWRWTLQNGDGSGSVVAAVGPANSINDGNWHHFAATFQRAGNGTAFLDGVQVASVVIASIGDLDTGEPTTVGQDPTGAYDDGLSDDVKYDLDDLGAWRRVLSPLEVEAMYVAAASNQVSFVSAPVRMQAKLVAGQLQLNWSGGLLQSAPAVSGPYADVPGATSPYSVAPTAAKQYYRIRQ